MLLFVSCLRSCATWAIIIIIGNKNDGAVEPIALLCANRHLKFFPIFFYFGLAGYNFNQDRVFFSFALQASYMQRRKKRVTPANNYMPQISFFSPIVMLMWLVSQNILQTIALVRLLMGQSSFKLTMKSIRIQMSQCPRVNQTIKQRKLIGTCTRPFRATIHYIHVCSAVTILL